MKHFDETKLAKLHTASELLESKYGKEGTKSRREFEEKARTYFHEVILRKQRKSRNTNRFPYTLYNIGAKTGAWCSHRRSERHSLATPGNSLAGGHRLEA